MGIATNLPQVAAVPRPDWLSRNWKWVVPVGLLSILLLMAAFVGSIFLILETSFQHSDCYQQALARARSSPQVLETIGQPLVSGWLTSGSVNISGPSGSADISIPISGPKGRGTIYVVAKKTAGEWSFQRLEVAAEGNANRIDLLKPEEGTVQENQ
jgi:hypothetical protein